MIRWSKYFVALSFFAAFFFSHTVDRALAGNSRPLTVVELFTSQGCSSCPPADAHLGELTEEEDLLALSFHVDYWDNLGWKDPYSSADNTRRQRTYARFMDLRYVYTPQMVIQGTLQATGSDRETIQDQIGDARKLPRIDVELTRNDKALQITLGKISPPVKADVFMVVFDKEHTTKVKRGENRGETITNRNVVRTLERIGSWRGNAANLSATLDENGDACAVIVQSRDSGTILGAATVALN
tara:strand:+ start:493 stop:1218 length:726 start_codon:yes stop_codon:yes gene_type:complete